MPTQYKRTRGAPLVVPFPAGLRALAAFGVLLLMMVAFDLGYTLGARKKPVVAVVEKPVAATSAPLPPPAAKPESTSNLQPAAKPAVVDTSPSAGADRFTAAVLPILKAKCVSCHGDPTVKGGLDVRTVATLKRGGNSGTALVPGSLAGSPLWTSIDDGTMPPAGKPKLTVAEMAVLHKWIAEESKAGP